MLDFVAQMGMSPWFGAPIRLEEAV
jgi:hypothetical protein